MSESQVPERVTRFFLESRDYNGLPLRTLLEEGGQPREELLAEIEEAVASGAVTLEFGELVLNPHIRSGPTMSPDAQITQLRTDGPDSVCAYPSPDLVRAHADVSSFDDRPYSQRLLLAESQLQPVYFDLTVLDKYQADPRYQFRYDDFAGDIGLRDDFYRSDDVAERDDVFLQSFGIGYDGKGNRVVVVFLRYLSDLSPEHQRVWQAQERSDTCKMNESYFRTSIRGEWLDHGSIYGAFLQEQEIINEMAAAMGREPFFQKTYLADRPREFSPFSLPTRRNYDNFASLLDRLISDNIGTRFFSGEVSQHEEVAISNGVIERRRRGSIAQLEIWLRRRFKAEDDASLVEMFETFRDIRKRRQRPAHSITRDEYDLNYYKMQDELMERGYTAVRNLRLVFATHPACASIQVPEWLYEGRIVTY